MIRRCYNLTKNVPLVSYCAHYIAMFISRYSQNSQHESDVPHDSRVEKFSLLPLLRVNRVYSLTNTFSLNSNEHSLPK